MLTKTSSSIMTSMTTIASKVEESKPAWLMGNNSGGSDPLGVQDDQDEEEDAFVGGGGPAKGGGGDDATGIFGLSSSPLENAASPLQPNPPQPAATKPPPSQTEGKERKAKSNTKATLDFLTGGMGSERSTKPRADVFGAFDDDESSSDEDMFSSREEAKVLEQKVAAVGLTTPPSPPPAFAPPSPPPPAPAPETKPAKEQPKNLELRNAVETIKRYMQDEGAGAPRSVWAAIEVFERQAGVDDLAHGFS
ncbi:hypothetical protein TrCOL_g3100 [Triparma columacea]|uniref:Uncharacterized protein n=1 Tax=Triparma columacea TaxID=722753 RepID=A0A9W7FXU0_9STRA|nr:hypothetical protein TrCOL_g3100 [Triparma columacea]